MNMSNKIDDKGSADSTKKGDGPEGDAKLVEPGSVGSTQRRRAEEGSLLSFCPQRPLHMLPYYHGRKQFDDVAGQLRKPGDYLLIKEADLVTLCVQAEDGKKHRQQIVRRPNDGMFIIEGEREHHAQGFTSIEELITYYEVYGLTVKEERPQCETQPMVSIRLDTPVTVRQDDKPPSDRRRPFRQLKDLAHFHGQLQPEEANQLLSADGDYLLREDPDKRGVFYLSVRGGGTYLHHVLERDPTSGGYALPRDQDLPVECVAMIDEWIQFHALYNVPVLAKYTLVRAIEKPKPKA